MPASKRNTSKASGSITAHTIATPAGITPQQIRAVEIIKAGIAQDVGKFKAYVLDNLAGSRMRKRTFSTPGIAEREVPRFTREQAMAKARQMVEDFPVVAGIVQSLVDTIVGSGFRLSMQTKDSGYNKAVEEAWRVGKNKLDIRGLRTFGQLQRLWESRQIIDGDIGLYLYPDPQTNSSYVQTIEADRIRGQKFDYLDQGVRNDEFGRAQAYFVGPRPKDQLDLVKWMAKGKEIAAQDFILYAAFPSERADQIRGTSALISNFNLFQEIAEIIEAVLQKVKNESFIALKFKFDHTPDGSQWGAGIESVKTDTDGVKRKHVRMVPGMNINPSPGEDVDVLESKSPNSSIMPFIKFLLRYGGTAFGMPLEVLLLDPSETNFSGMRVVLELAKRRTRVKQEHLAHVSSRVFQWWLAREIKHFGAQSGLKPPKSIAGTEWLHRWGKLGTPSVNPFQDAQTHALMIDRHLASPQQILADTSDRDEEEVLAEIDAHMKACNKRGIPMLWGAVSTRVTDKEQDPALTPKENA